MYFIVFLAFGIWSSTAFAKSVLPDTVGPPYGGALMTSRTSITSGESPMPGAVDASAAIS
jgi:hypothetical protein